MKSIRLIALGCGGAAVALAALVLPTAAQAGGSVSWSVGIFGGAPVYHAPAPVYAQPYAQPYPQPYVQARPIYVQPQPVYVQPRPVYVGPPPYYGGTVVAAPPVYVQPRAVYPIDWEPRGHWRHRHHGRGPGWRY